MPRPRSTRYVLSGGANTTTTSSSPMMSTKRFVRRALKPTIRRGSAPGFRRGRSPRARREPRTPRPRYEAIEDRVLPPPACTRLPTAPNNGEALRTAPAALLSHAPPLARPTDPVFAIEPWCRRRGNHHRRAHSPLGSRWRCVPDAEGNDAATSLHSEGNESGRLAFDPVLWNHLESQRLGASCRGGGTLGLGRTVSLWLRGLSRDPQGAIAG